MRRFFGNGANFVLLIPLGALLVGVLYPVVALLGKSVADANGVNVGFANYWTYCTTPGQMTALYHSVSVGLTVSAAVTALGFFLAYAFTHARVFGNRACRYVALLPLYVPSVFFPVGMIHLFGRNGLFAGLFGMDDVYGRGGVVFGEIVFVLPHAYLILLATLEGVDQRLYRAARTLGASPWRRFHTLTVPHCRIGLARAFLVSFILTITDFGIPKVLGGDYSMLSTELYTQIIGLQNMGVASAIGVVMLVPSILVFAIDLFIMRTTPRFAQTDGNDVPQKSFGRDGAASLFAWGLAGVPAVIILAAIGVSVITFWPYDLSLTLDNYRFANSVYGIRPFYNSAAIAAMAAVIGMIATFTGAYLVLRARVNRFLSFLFQGLSFLAFGIPGTVLGLAFVFAFNRTGAVFEYFYGTRLLLVFYCLIHFYAMGHLVSAAGLSDLDRHYEDAGKTLKVSRFSTFFRVIVPIRMHVALDVAFYFFINSMTTVSGMVFLFTPDNVPASVAMLHFTDTGYYGEAAAMGALVLAATLAARMAQEAIRWRCGKARSNS